MRRNSVAMAWGFGILGTFVVYAVGPDRFVTQMAYALGHLGETLEALADQLIYGAFDLMRALALGLYGVFVVLCVLAHRRGLRAIRPLVVVSVLFLALIGAFGTADDMSVSRHWLGAFVLAGIGAAVMTRRLSAPAAVVPAGVWTAR